MGSRLRLKSAGFGFIWYDFWIGWFWQRSARKLWIAPFPMFVFCLEFAALEAGNE